MQQTLCLWLVLLVLSGALCLGNPFLSPADQVAPSALPAHSGSAAPGHGLPVAEPALGGAAVPTAFALEARPRSTGNHGGAINALDLNLSAKGIVPASLPALPSEPLCPDVALRALVKTVEWCPRGQPIWVLSDGRRFVRNPRGAEPLLVPAGNSAPLK